MKMVTPFQDKMWFHNTILLSKLIKKRYKKSKKSVTITVTLCYNKRDIVTTSVTVTRDIVWQVTRNDKTLVGGCSLAVLA